MIHYYSNLTFCKDSASREENKINTNLSTDIKTNKNDISAIKLDISELSDVISGIDVVNLYPIKQDIIELSDTLNVVMEKLSGINDNKKSISKLETKATLLSNNITDIKTDISSLKSNVLKIENNISNIKVDNVNLDPIKQDIVDLTNTLDIIKNKITTIDDNKKNINNLAIKQDIQTKDIQLIKSDINALQIEDVHIFEILGDIQKTISKFTDNNDEGVSIADLIEGLSKLENIDINLNNNISNLKEKVEKILKEGTEATRMKAKEIIKNDLSKSIDTNKTNISNIEIKINDIYSRLSNISNTSGNGNDVDLEPIKNDISDLTKYIDDIRVILDQYKSKISKLESDNTSSINKIKNINNDIIALKNEDTHIFEIISDIQNKLNGITDGDDSVVGDVEKLKSDVNVISNNSNSLRKDINDISKNISNINTTLSKRINITESDIVIIKNNISELEDTINNILKTNFIQNIKR